ATQLDRERLRKQMDRTTADLQDLSDHLDKLESEFQKKLMDLKDRIIIAESDLKSAETEWNRETDSFVKTINVIMEKLIEQRLKLAANPEDKTSDHLLRVYSEENDRAWAGHRTRDKELSQKVTQSKRELTRFQEELSSQERSHALRLRRLEI